MKMKDLDFRILFGLMKNSKISDRKLAEIVGVSQPTVTRKRARLEKEAIDGYTLIPKWAKLGYEILAFTFVKSKQTLGLKEKYKAAQERGTKWLMTHANVIMSGGCRGMGMDGFMISVHKSYSDFDSFMAEQKRELGDTFTDVHTVLVNLGGSQILKPLHFKYLTEGK